MCPWEASDAQRHTKKATGKKASQWSKVANSVLKETGDEARAVRTANGVIKANHSPSQRKDRKS
jgi:hypothetical protein